MLTPDSFLIFSKVPLATSWLLWCPVLNVFLVIGLYQIGWSLLPTCLHPAFLSFFSNSEYFISLLFWYHKDRQKSNNLQIFLQLFSKNFSKKISAVNFAELY